MSVKSTETRYGAVIVVVHWVSAVLILALIVSGLRADGLTDETDKAAVLSLHISLGFGVLALTLFRLVWWQVADRKPPPSPMRRWQHRVARAVHALLYLVVLGTIVSGIAMLAQSGAAPIIFGTSAAALPDFHSYGPRAPHGFGAVALIALLALHAGAAFHHHFIKKDGLLNRMWFGKP
ncbi:MAG: cytochrome b/b6 domain-containing protein [Pseudomonadota bacterium]